MSISKREVGWSIDLKEIVRSLICIVSFRYEYLITSGSLCEMLRCVPCLVLSLLRILRDRSRSGAREDKCTAEL